MIVGNELAIQTLLVSYYLHEINCTHNFKPTKTFPQFPTVYDIHVYDPS